jgi:hypothetical protein
MKNVAQDNQAFNEIIRKFKWSPCFFRARSPPFFQTFFREPKVDVTTINQRFVIFRPIKRESKLLDLLKLDPPFMDLEYDMRKDFLEKALKNHPKTAFILSYHNFEKTPDDLENLFQMMSIYPAYQYKIAAMALSTIDALRMLLFAKEHLKVSVICMGEKGEFARVLGPVVGNLLNYANLEKRSKQHLGSSLCPSSLISIIFHR